MSDAEPVRLSTLQRLNRLKIDDAFYQRNTFDKGNLDTVLWELFVGYDLTDSHLEAVFSLIGALQGTNPCMSLEVNRIPEGRIPRPLREQQKGSLAMAIGDRIDKKVAHGVKQDSIIHEIIQETGISRREIFRMLKSARQQRAILKATEDQLADWDCWYDDFDIADDGTLVPATRD